MVPCTIVSCYGCLASKKIDRKQTIAIMSLDLSKQIICSRIEQGNAIILFGSYHKLSRLLPFSE